MSKKRIINTVVGINEVCSLIQDKDKVLIIKNRFNNDKIKLRVKNTTNINLKTIARALNETFGKGLFNEFQYAVEDYLVFKYKMINTFKS